VALPKITAGCLKHKCRHSVGGASKALASVLLNGVCEAISHSVRGGSHHRRDRRNANGWTSRPQPIVMFLRRVFMEGSFFPFAILLLDFPLLCFAMESSDVDSRPGQLGLSARVVSELAVRTLARRVLRCQATGL
jgi:hypothetical protein